MEPCAQVLATCPCPERDRPSLPCHSIYLGPILILSSHLCLGLASNLFPSGFSTNALYAFLFSPSTRHMPRIFPYP